MSSSATILQLLSHSWPFYKDVPTSSKGYASVRTSSLDDRPTRTKARAYAPATTRRKPPLRLRCCHPTRKLLLNTRHKANNRPFYPPHAGRFTQIPFQIDSAASCNILLYRYLTKCHGPNSNQQQWCRMLACQSIWLGKSIYGRNLTFQVVNTNQQDFPVQKPKFGRAGTVCRFCPKMRRHRSPM